jgi:SSS family solute:Na+ symporter
MQSLDYLVIGLYFVAMLLVGGYYGRRVKNVDDYLLGGRRMSPFMIGLSLFATLTSTLSYLALPGEVIKNGPMMMAQYLGFIPAMALVGWWLIPAIMRQENVTSGYELLERRLGLTGRLLGAAMFVLLRTIWMASILYATSDKVIVPLFHLDRSWTPYLCVALGVLTIIYTSEGGIRAVVATDAAQSLIMFAGAVITIAVVSLSRPGEGLGWWWPQNWQAQWQEPVFWFRPDVRVTFCGACLNMFVWMTCTAGSDQMAIQRYLATRDVAAARRSFGIHLVVEVLMSLLLGLVGLAVLAYFTNRPEQFGPNVSLVEQADELFPRFVVVGLPAGLTGLVIAAILSAAMSSLSSGMNSASAVIVRDFLGRSRTQPIDMREQVRSAKLVAAVVGFVAVGLSMLIPGLADNLLELCVRVVNLLTSPLFVLFFLALFVPWATPAGGVLGVIASTLVAIAIAFYKVFGLEFLWTAPCALLAGVLVGCLASWLTPHQRRDRIAARP